MVLPRQLRLDYHFVEVALVLLDALHYIVPDFDKVLLLDDEAQRLQDLLLVSQVLIAAARGACDRWHASLWYLPGHVVSLERILHVTLVL